MKRVTVVALIAVAGILAIFVGAGVLARVLLSGSLKDTLTASLSQTLKVPVSVGSVDFDLGQWLRLRPSLALRQVAISNPKGFSSRRLLEADEMTAQVDFLSVFGKNVRVHSITVQKPRIYVEENRQGLTNIEVLVQGLASSGTSGGPALSIDSFSVASGEFVYAGRDELSAHAIDLRLRDFGADRTPQVELAAKLFRANRSNLRFTGRAGPKAEGKLEMVLYPADMPAALRQREFGDLLAEPGDAAVVRLEASLAGDIQNRLSGPAKVEFSKFLVGREKDHRMPLEGQAPLTLTVIKPLGVRTSNIQIPSAVLRLGKGEWKSRDELSINEGGVRGSSSGSIRNVAIEEMLSTFTTAKERIYGLLEIPQYSISFAGKDADRIRDSLSGNAMLSIMKGRVSALDLLASIQRAIENPGQDPTDTQGSTEFSTLTAVVEIRNQQILVSQLKLESPVTSASGEGAIGFDQTLALQLNVRVAGRLAELLGKRAQGSQPAEALVPVTITGTVASPQVRPNLGKMMKQSAIDYLDIFLKKKLKK